MPEMTEPYYVSMLKGHGFTPDPDDHQYGALGLCWKISQEIGEGSYWTYGQKDLYDIKIHNLLAMTPSPGKSCRPTAGCPPGASRPISAGMNRIRF